MIISSMALIIGNCMKKINLNLCIAAIFALNNMIYADTQVTSKFNNIAEFPVLFQSFRDQDKNPIETKIIAPHELYISNVQANSTVRYAMTPHISTQRLSMSTGSKNIVYNTSTNQFALQAASLNHKNAQDPYLSDTSVMRITNTTTFPINISVVLKDAGQVTPTLVPDSVKNHILTPNLIPAQALNQTRLPVGGSYATDDPITNVTISCAVKKYVSHDLPLAQIKNQYDIVHEFGKITMIPQDHRILQILHNL